MPENIIVVGVDGSPSSVWAQREAARLAMASGAQVLAVHCVPPLVEVFGIPPTFDQEAWEADLLYLLDTQWCQPLRRAGASHTTRLLHFNPAEGLTLAADEADAVMIVVGLHPHGMFGSGRSHVIGHLLQQSHVPVLVVPAGPDGWAFEPTVGDDTED